MALPFQKGKLMQTENAAALKENRIEELAYWHISHLKTARHCTSHTIKNRVQVLTKFCNYLIGKNILYIQNLSLECVNAYAGIHLRELKNSTRITHASAVRCFLEWAQDNGMLIPWLKFLEIPKPERRLPRYLTPSEIQRIFGGGQACPEPRRTRDQAVLELFYFSGIRLGELRGLNVESLDFEQGTVLVYGKGSKERDLPLHDRPAASIKKYLHLRREAGEHINERSPLFLSRLGRRISGASIGEMIKARAKEVGILKRVHPHLFRHSFASNLIGRGRDIRTIQELLGHSNLNSTQIYTHVAMDAKRRAVNALS